MHIAWKIIFFAVFFGLLFQFGRAAGEGVAPVKVEIKTNQSEVGMGRTLTLEATATLPDGRPGAGWLLLPYVDGKRWGAHETADARGRAVFHIPLPHPGATELRVQAAPPSEEWLWTQRLTVHQKVWLRGELTLPATITAPSTATTNLSASSATTPTATRQAWLWVAAEHAATVWINGQEAGKFTMAAPQPVPVGPLLRAGANTIAIAAEGPAGPAGVLARLEVASEAGTVTCLSDRSWRVATTQPAGWPEPAAEALDAPATIVGSHYVGLWAGALPGWPLAIAREALFAGYRLPDDAIVSAPVTVTVNWRKLTVPPEDPEHLVCAQWEPFLVPGNTLDWKSAQAVPLSGFYWACNSDVHRQHLLWLAESGVDFLLVDWAGAAAWEKEHFDERSEVANAIIHATTVMLETMARMRDEGLRVPRMALIVFHNNGPATSWPAVRENLDWIYQNYLRNPRFKGLFQEYEGKPLVVLFNGAGPALYGKDGKVPVEDPRFTIRWMSSQSDSNHLNEAGYWSWMDGSVDPPLTLCDGKPEMMTVSTAFFSIGGWLGKSVHGRRNGATYVDSFRTVLTHRPRLIQLHQFQEFAGQFEGAGYGPEMYGDSYSPELSDDIEPVSLTAHAYRGEGGWGYLPLNLTRAMVDLYRQPADNPQTTVLAIPAPLRGQGVTSDTLDLTWTALGKPAASYTVTINGQPVASGIKENKATVDLRPFAAGPLTLRVTAEGTQCRYPPSWTEDSLPLEQPVPAYAEVEFTRQK